MVSMALVAKAHGAKFERPSKLRVSSAIDQEAELAQLLATIPQRQNPR